MSTDQDVALDDLVDVSSEDEEERNMAQLITDLTKRISENPESVGKLVEMNENLINMTEPKKSH